MPPVPGATHVVVDLACRVADTLAATSAAGRTGPVVVAFDGRSGAGKSTLAAEVAAELSAGMSVAVVPGGSRGDVPVTTVTLEVLYPGWNGLAAGTRVWSQLVARLARGRSATYEPWDWARGRPGSAVTVDPAPLVLAEGVGAGVRAARPHLDLLIWVAAPAPLRRARALTRDGDVFVPWWDAWAAQEDGLLAADPIPDHADLVVDASAPDAAQWRAVTGPGSVLKNRRP